MNLNYIKNISFYHLAEPKSFNLERFKSDVKSVSNDSLPELEQLIDVEANNLWKSGQKTQSSKKRNLIVGSMLTAGGVLLGIGAELYAEDISAGFDTTSPMAIVSLTCMAVGLAVIATAALIHFIQSRKSKKLQGAKISEMDKISQIMKSIVCECINSEKISSA